MNAQEEKEVGTIAHTAHGTPAEFAELIDRLAGCKRGEIIVIGSGRQQGKSRFIKEFLAQQEKAALKGVFGGNCNVTACQKPGANYFNKSTRKYYCAECAAEINWPGGRADTMALYGVPLLCDLEVQDGETQAQAALESRILRDGKVTVTTEPVSFDDFANIFYDCEPIEVDCQPGKRKAQWKQEVNRGRRR